MREILNSAPVRWATILLLAQAALLYSSIHPEAIPESTPLVQMPQSLGAWNAIGRDGVVEQEILDVLKADDLLNRQYATATGESANLFIAAFRSQRNGKAPHSPKNCLPGSGWAPVLEEETSIDVGEAAPIVVNRYIVAHGEQRSMVMYWYQSRGRVVANEYKAKFWVVADAMRYNRTDTALVRVIVDIHNQDSEAAERTGTAFVKTFYPAVRQILPQ
jgi:EpsI family protein